MTRPGARDHGRLDVHTVADVRAAAPRGRSTAASATCSCTSATPRSATRPGSASSSAPTAAPAAAGRQLVLADVSPRQRPAAARRPAAPRLTSAAGAPGPAPTGGASHRLRTCPPAGPPVPSAMHGRASPTSRRRRRSRDRPWVMRTYAGHSSAAASNALYRRNLAKGQTGLSVAFDLPTQTGYDPDHALARGEVGKVGVPVSHVGDMRALFDGHPAGRDEHLDDDQRDGDVAARALPGRRARSRRRGAAAGRGPGRVVRALAGTTQNDIIKEYLSRGTYVFPPGPSLRLITDMVAYTVARCPVEPDQRLQLPPAGGRRDAGAGDRLRDVHRGRRARRGARLRPGAARGVRRGRRAGSRSSSTRACGSSRRCARCARSSQLWDELTRERYGVTDPKQRRFRYGVQVNSLGLTEAQPENNVQRIVLEMLGGHPVAGRAGPGGAAAGVERGARPAAAVGPAVVAADPAGPRLRVRPARVRRPVRRLARSSRRRSPSCVEGARAEIGPGAARWAARSPRSSPAT